MRTTLAVLVVGAMVVGAATAALTIGAQSEAVTSVAECMRSKGYENYDLGTNDPLVASEADFAHEYGYGISVPTPVIRIGGPESQQARADHTRDEAVCLEDALSGTVEGEARSSYQRLYEHLVADPGGWVEVAGEEDGFDHFVLALPGVAEGLEGWQKCMAERGFSFEVPADAWQAFEDGYAALVGSGQARYAITPDGATELTQEVTGSDEETLATLQEEERRTAVADQGCKEAELYPAVIAAVEVYLGGSG